MATAARPKLTVQSALDLGDEEKRRETRKEETSVRREVADMRSQRDEALQLANEWKGKFELMKSECSQVRKQADELQRRNNECQAIIVRYEQEIERVRGKGERREREMDGVDGKRELRVHTRDVAVRNQEVERLRKTTERYEARISELECQREELVERIEMSTNREAELGRALEAEQQAKEKANSRNRALSQQIAGLHDRFEKLSHDRVNPNDESERLRREYQMAKEENVMTWKRYTEAAHERDRVSKELYRVIDKLSVATEELDVMSVRLKDEQTMRQELEKRMVDRVAQGGDADSSMSGRYDGANKQVKKDLEFAIESYRSTLKQRDSVLEEVGQLRMENEVLTNQTRIRTQELDELKQKYNNVKIKMFHLNGMVQRLREVQPELVKVVVPFDKELGVLLETYVHVREVQPNSIGSKRGIIPGDIVLQVSGQFLANLSVAEVGHLIESSHSELTLLLKRQPTARLDDVMVNELTIDAMSLQTQGESKSLDSYRPNATLKRKDVGTTKVWYGSGSSLTTGTKYSEVASLLSTPTFLDGPSHVARKHEREVVIMPPSLNSTSEGQGLVVQLKGGNMVGIFIAHVRKDGPAGGKHGLKKGDQLLKVNECAMTACTLEEAYATFLKSMLLGPVKLVVSRDTKKYRSLAVPYDSFFVRCNFNYDGSAVNEMSFGIGDVMHITESAPAHFKESWMARRLGVDGTQAAFGAVPNEIRAQVYLRASGQFSADHSMLAYERIDPSQVAGVNSHVLDGRNSASTRERTASLLGDQSSLHDRLSAHEARPGCLPSHITEELCQLLDRDSPTERNWRDLTVMLGLGDSIPDLAQRSKPMAEVLRAWREGRGEKGSVEWLVKALFRMGRVDAAVLLEPFAEHSISVDTGTRSMVVGMTNV
ncbi:caspase recruitment domain-containing protein 14-like isoform X2 [Corticium candelabrum]|uniref:caspase recruitment domain-containing protein 14-like isoform X2 n=1 Tax=Corticium candelabrum TaxID=121492 RepID=UPI002E26244F|nr:caspase recruitment domain-containing protein 14-like isoform X2 [Corticium candelabrum]